MADRTINILVIAALVIGVVWAARSFDKQPSSRLPTVAVLTPDMVPLVTGNESIVSIFTRAGCPVCHSISGIPGAEGRVGPPLHMGSTGPERLRDRSYRGRAKTVREYVIESVVEPGAFVVPDYPADTMPTWYGAKLSALALDKIAMYLEQQTADGIATGS